ncbi:rhamnulokinase [Oryzibacter oryziterrae]|uniref:rhamnulokinase n=1 Tax=Oryzibacter oryziterrae TaxID=2766474 RepID=UPI001EFF6EBC|nr:rhamnulokinase [Oryzibacter oryziterrae]
MQETSPSKPTRVAAVDMGAGSGRVMVAELSDGHLSLTEVHRFETPHVVDQVTGHEAWDHAKAVANIREGLEKAEAVAPIDSVGCDTWGVDFVLLDEDLQQVGPAVAYRDHRTDGMIEAVTATMPADEIYARTGIQFAPYNSIYQLAAIAKQHPDWLKRARHLLFTPDYLHFALSGVVSNEYTIATTSQLLNLKTRDWDPDLIKLAGLPHPLMKTPIQPGSVVGEMRLETSGRIIKVIAPGGHDTASAVAAAPLTGADEAFVSSGTWSLMGIESETPYAGALARQFNVSNEGGVCGRYRVLKNLMGLWLIMGVRKEMGAASFAEVVKAAEAAPAWGFIFNPDDQRLLNPDSMLGAIHTIIAEQGQALPEDIGVIARAIFDSLALDYARVKAELEALTGRPITKVRIIGGGSQNQLLNQLTADACGVTVSAGPIETSALGNACLQMMALGAIGSLEEAREIVRQSFAVTEVAPKSTVPTEVREHFAQLH